MSPPLSLTKQISFNLENLGTFTTFPLVYGDLPTTQFAGSSASAGRVPRTALDLLTKERWECRYHTPARFMAPSVGFFAELTMSFMESERGSLVDWGVRPDSKSRGHASPSAGTSRPLVSPPAIHKFSRSRTPHSRPLLEVEKPVPRAQLLERRHARRPI
jgi:hypothetical protein